MPGRGVGSRLNIPNALPRVQGTFKALFEAGAEALKWAMAMGGLDGELKSLGFPNILGGFTKAPFDVFGDTLRGTRGIIMDMYRQPDKLLNAMEALVPIMIGMGVGASQQTGNPQIFMPLHKGADGFLSDEQFKKFYWPTFKAVMLGLIENGCVPCCFVEGGYNDRLDYLTEIPKGQCIYIFDRTDMAQARKVLGGKSCIGGGFPISLILTGNVQQVEDRTKKLLDDAAGDGGYILSIGCAMDEAREDTLKAFIQTGKEYGKY